jgi:ferrochelatase
MSKRGVLLVNLGSPDSPSVGDVRRYLRQFLMDGRVIDMAYVPRFLLVNCCILPFRPKQSAEAYRSIWWPEGSPLVVITQRVAAHLRANIPYPLEVAMRYQRPSIGAAVQNLARQGVTELLLIPLFPHYAMSSYETAVEEVKSWAAKTGIGQVHIVPPFYDHPDYVAALVASAQKDLDAGYDHLLFSFHGLPERHLKKSDPTGCHCLNAPNCCQTPSPAHATCYRAQCFKTVDAFVKRAGVTRYSVSFQSRLGRDPWLRPYTDHEVIRFPKEGKKKLLVICPAFVSDCLETIEEIGIRAKESFLEAGGQEFRLIPCLNEHPLWLAALKGMIDQAFPSDPAKNNPESQHERHSRPGVVREARLG